MERGPDTRGSAGRLGLALALCAAIHLLALARSHPPATLGPDAPADRFSAARALAALERVIGGAGPHPAGSAAHARVRGALLAELAGLGLAPRVQETLGRGGNGNVAVVRNVLAEIPSAATAPRAGGSAGGKSVLLAAHYDSVGTSPGAGDDGSGVASLLEVARALRSSPALPRPVVLLFTDAEEVGLVGAAAFCAEDPAARSAGVVINVEARGTSGPCLMFETAGANRWLIEALARSAPRPAASSVSDLVYKNLPNDTDLSAFRAIGLPGLNFAFVGGLARYHTPVDDLAHLDPASVQHQGETVLALARELARADLDAPRAGDLVYADVLGLAVLRWPSSWCAPLALVAAAILAWTAVRAVRACRASAGGLLRGALACLAAPLAALLLAFLWGALLRTVRGVLDPATAHPAPARIALVAGALLAALSAAPLVRGTEPLAAWLGAWVPGALSAVLLALVAPEASYLAIVPALAAAVAAPLPPTVRALLPLAATAIVWLPLGPALELVFGFGRPELCALPLAAAAAAIAPALAGAPLRVLRAIALVAVLALGAALAALLVVPTHDADHPAWLNVRYIANRDRGSARFDVSTFGARLPAELREAAPLERSTEPPFPWLSLDPSLYVAPAPPWDVPSPDLAILGSRSEPGGRVVTGRLRSLRGATRLHLHLPPEVELRSVRWGDHALDGFGSARSTIFCAIPSEGLEVELFVPGAEPVEVWVLDQDWAMPDEARALGASRPGYAVPRSDGDVSILGRSVRIQ